MKLIFAYSNLLLFSIMSSWSFAASRDDLGLGTPPYYYILAIGIVFIAVTTFFITGKRGKKILSTIKIRTSLYILNGFVMLTAVIVGVYGISSMNKVGDEIKEIAEQDIPLTEIVTLIETHQLEQAIWFERALRFSLENHQTEYNNAKKTFLDLAHKVDKEIKTGKKFARAAVEEQSVTTQEIANNVSQAANSVQEVNENVNQTNAVAAEVSENIAEVSLAAGETSSGSRQVKVSAGELSELAETLNGMVAQFKV